MDLKARMDFDMCQCSWLVDKVRESEIYSQNLYAAMCNNEFQHQDFWHILRGDRWSCSWRSAGEIVADIRGSGDYLDWYCSGSFFHSDTKDVQGYVPEGMITEEIHNDLVLIGWRPVDIDSW